MAGEKYVVASAENPVQIAIRNILNPSGYVYLGNCNDSISLLRLIRSFHPDFIAVDAGMKLSDLRNTLETIDDEMLCACVIIGEYKDSGLLNLLENSRVIMLCPKPLNREMLIHTVEMANINFKRVSELNTRLKEMTENYETRKAVERAKWVLMQRDGLSEKEAYERMRKKSMDSRMSMKSIADAIIFTYEITGKNI
jgi:response regulator NasT